MDQQDISQLLQNFNLSSLQHYSKDTMHKIAVAPMLDVTYNHQRVFMRLLTRCSTLWTEMIHENAILNTKFGAENLLKFNLIEKPLVLQLGGNNPENLLKCSEIAFKMGYDEINLNVGCPSSKVQVGAFGACLMKTPEVVINCVNSMRKSNLPVTIKCRLGVDEFDSYEFAKDFIQKVHEQGQISHFIIHARKAFLQGLNPKENRNIPPLKYEWVIQLKKDLPQIQFSINGGFTQIESIQEILKQENNLQGCMIGRAAMDNPWLFSEVDSTFFNLENPGYSRREVLQIYGNYCQEQLNENPQISFPQLTKPIVNLFHGLRNNGKYRQHLAEYKEYKLNKNFYDLINDAIKIMDVEGSRVYLDQKPSKLQIM